MVELRGGGPAELVRNDLRALGEGRKQGTAAEQNWSGAAQGRAGHGSSEKNGKEQAVSVLATASRIHLQKGVAGHRQEF